MRIKARNPTGSIEYYHEPYTMQHLWDWAWQFPRLLVVDIPMTIWESFSNGRRIERARQYNRAMFDNIPTSQIYVLNENGVRPLREDERTWPE